MKRCRRKLGLCLLLGAIFNVAVGWACCVRAYQDGVIRNAPPHRAPNVAEIQRFKAEAPNGIEEPFEMWVVATEGYQEIRLQSHGPTCIKPDGSRSEIIGSSCWTESGVPMRGLSGEWFATPDVSTGQWQMETHGMVQPRIELPLIRSWNYPPYLPWRPRWPGFALNTVFYAAIIWMMFTVPGTVRRRIRALGGRCTACGYDLRGCARESIICPECGASGSNPS